MVAVLSPKNDLWLTQSSAKWDMSKVRFPFPSFPVLWGFPAVWHFKVLPVCLALAALHPAEEPLDESFGFCSDCGQTRTVSGRSSHAQPEPSHMVPLPYLGLSPDSAPPQEGETSSGRRPWTAPASKQRGGGEHISDHVNASRSPDTTCWNTSPWWQISPECKRGPGIGPQYQPLPSASQAWAPGAGPTPVR